MKKFLTFFMSAAVCAVCAGAATACASNDDSLVIGITIYSPMNYYDENDKLIGFDTEFAEKACAELGYFPKFQVIDWDNKISELQTGKIDVIWNGMTITDELKEKIAITDPYMDNRQVVVVKAENADKYSTIADLANASSVAVESGSAGETVCSENGCDSLIKKEAQSDCLLEVKTGRSEIAVIDYTMARAMTGAGTDYTDLVYKDVGFAAEQYGIGMRKSDEELLKNLNAIIAKYSSDGTFDELIEKYMV